MVIFSFYGDDTSLVLVLKSEISCHFSSEMATSFSVQKNARNEAIALQAKAKALREQQRTRIDARHKYILGLVADRLDLELSAVEDFMLDGDQVS